MSESINAVRKMLEDNTALCARGNAVFYSKRVTESIIYQFLQIALPKERQGIRLADIRSAIKENQDFKRLLEDIAIPKEQLVTYVNPLTSCYETPQRRKAVTKSSKKLQQELTSQDEEMLQQDLTSQYEEMLQEELTHWDEEMLQQELTDRDEEMLQEELIIRGEEMLQQKLASQDQEISMKTSDSIDFKVCLQQKKRKKRKKITMPKCF